MPSTYTLNNGIELIATGAQSGTWGDTTNINLALIDTALDGQVTTTLVSAGSSGSPNTLPITDGSASDGRNRLVIFDDGGDLGATAYVQLTPNDAEKIVYIRNDLSGSRSIILFQGTYNASNDYEVPAGTTAIVFFNGGGAGAVAANVFNNAFFDSLRLGSVSVTAILDEDNMASDSATALATQQSIKAYVDAQVTAQDLDFAGDSGTGAVDLDSQTFTVAGTTDQITTSASGQTITVSLPATIATTTADLTNIEVTNIKAKDGTASATIADSTGVMTVASSVLTTTDINGGTIDGATIATSDITVGAGKTLDVSAGTLTLANDQISGNKIQGGTIGSITITTLTGTTGNITNVNATTVDATNIEVTNIKAKDGTASATIADATGVMTIASSVLTTTDINGGTIDGVTIGGASAGAGTFTSVTGTSLNMNGAAVFNESGADVDFRIESDTNANAFFLQGSDGKIGIGTASPLQSLHVNSNGNTQLLVSSSFNNSTVTGLVVDTVGDSSVFRISATKSGVGRGTLSFLHSSTAALETWNLNAAGSTVYAAGYSEHIWKTGNNERMRITSTGNVGIGTSSPVEPLHVARLGGADNTLPAFSGITAIVTTPGGTSASSGSAITIHSNVDGQSALYFSDTDDSDVGYISYSHSGDILRFGVNNSERMRIDASGNVGIGTASPATTLDVNGTITGTTGNITTVNATTVDTTNIEVTNIKAKDGTASATIADSTGVMTVASSVLTTTDINGGTIDGVTIGGASAGAGTFTSVTGTSLDMNGDADFGGNIALSQATSTTILTELMTLVSLTLQCHWINSGSNIPCCMLALTHRFQITALFLVIPCCSVLWMEVQSLCVLLMAQVLCSTKAVQTLTSALSLTPYLMPSSCKAVMVRLA
jgi:hypothetical protein